MAAENETTRAEGVRRPDPSRPSRHAEVIEPGNGADPTIPRPLPAPPIDRLGDPVLTVDQTGTLRYANQTAVELLGWELEEIVGRSVLDKIHPDDVAIAATSMETVMTKPIGHLLRLRVRHGRGNWVHLELRGRPDLHEGVPVIVLVARDITNRHELDFDRGDAEMLRTVMSNMHSMVALIRSNGEIKTINRAVTRLLGHDQERLRGRELVSYIHEDDRDHVIDSVRSVAPNDTINLDARIRSSDGAHHTCEFTVSNLLDDPGVGAYLVSAQISSSLVDARKRVDFLAEHDSRTGLLNRDGFMKAAQELMQAGGGLGIMIVDVVHFRSINELYGEPAGDAVLAAVAEHLDEMHWPDLIAARFGGDEFVVAVRSSSAGAIEMLRERVRRNLPSSIKVADQEVNFAVRSVTAYEAQPQGLESLLVSASNELTSVKRHAVPERTGITYDAINERRNHLDQLRNGLSNGEVAPYFQPIVDENGRIRAVEALVRWTHPVRGVLGVGDILPLAQMAGLAEEIDERVFDMALDFARRLCDAGHGDIEVHVNVDPKVISVPSFAQSFLDRCERANANPAQMVVELTETDLLSPGVVSLDNMQQMRRAGTHVSIDDFGTGYSSLAHLLELPVDGVKIDRRFVAGIDVDPAATNLTNAILGLSHSLGLACVAEGVEQPYQRDRLAERGCASFQGWLYSPAVSPDEIFTMLPAIEPTISDDAPRPEPHADVQRS